MESKKKKSLETKSQPKELKESLKRKMPITPSVPASGIIAKCPTVKPVTPGIPCSSSSKTNVKPSINSPSASKKFVLLVPQSMSPLPPPQPPTPSQWPPADDSEIFSISLARFSKERRVAIKKKIIEFLEAVDKRNIDPEQIIMALCSKS